MVKGDFISTVQLRNDNYTDKFGTKPEFSIVLFKLYFENWRVCGNNVCVYMTTNWQCIGSMKLNALGAYSMHHFRHVRRENAQKLTILKTEHLSTNNSIRKSIVAATE